MKNCLLAILLCCGTALHADVTGALVTPDGAPVAGGRVEIFAKTPFAQELERLVAGAEEEPLAAAESDSKGNFKLTMKKRGNYVVRAFREGFAPAAVQTTGTEDLGGILLKPAAMKQGRVTANGKPVANARLLFFGEFARLTVRTDEKGSYSVPDPPLWQAAVQAFHPGFAVHYGSTGLNRSVSLDIALREGTTVRGRVLDPSGKNGAKAKLFVDGLEMGASGDDGSFELRHVAPQWREIVAVSGGLVARSGRSTAATLRLARPVVFSGRVVDARTRVPLAGAVVSMNTEFAFAASDPATTTDEKGSFVLDTLLPGKYVVRATHAGYGTATARVTIDAPSTKTIYLQPEARFVGRITGDDRQPIGGADVRAFVRAQNYFFFDRGGPVSAPDGRYAVGVEPSRLEVSDLDVQVTRRGYAMTKDGPHALNPGEEKRVDVVLTHGVALTGRVSNNAGDSLEGVSVAALELVGKSNFSRSYLLDWSDQPLTGKDGAFTLPLRPGTWDLYFHKQGFAPRKLGGVKVPNTTGEEIAVTLDPPAMISGRVVTSDGEGVPDLQVSATIDGPPVNTRTDQSGEFVIDGLPATTIAVRFTSADETVNELRPMKAPAENVTIELVPTVRVSGRIVTRDGNAISDFTTDIKEPEQSDSYSGGMDRPQTFHDADGRFVLENVAVRPSELVVEAPGYVRSRIALQLVKGKNVEDVELTLDRAGSVTGRITNTSGAPLERVHVYVDGPGGRPMADTTSDANGDYAIDGIPLGERELVFRKLSYQLLRKQVLVDGSGTRADAQLQNGKTLSGRVVTDTVSPVAEAEVRAWSAGVDSSGASAVTDSSGRFRLEGLGSGIYTVVATRRGYVDARMQDVDVDGAGELTLKLSVGATIAGRIVGIDRSQYREISVAAAGHGNNASGTVDPAGNYRIEGAPVGKVGVRAFARGSSTRTSELLELETENGGTYTADLEFKEHNTVSGRVSQNGVPLRAGNVAFTRRTGPRHSVSGAIGNDGSYVVTGVPSGEYNVIVSNPRLGIQYATARTVTRSQTIDIDIRPATATVRVIHDATGEPVADAWVSLRSTDPEPMPNRPEGRSGADGRVVIENISPGEYDVNVSREGFAAQLLRRNLGEGANADFEVRLTPSEGFRLTLIDGRNGRPVSGAITARNGAGVIVFNDYYGDPAADGSLHLPLAPGTYRVNIFSPGLGSVYVNASSPGSERVTLRPGGTLEFETSGSIRVRVLSADGAVYNVDPGEVSPINVVLDGTLYTDMAAGAYMVQVLDGSNSVVKSERIEIREGQITRVRI